MFADVKGLIRNRVTAKLRDLSLALGNEKYSVVHKVIVAYNLLGC